LSRFLVCGTVELVASKMLLRRFMHKRMQEWKNKQKSVNACDIHTLRTPSVTHYNFMKMEKGKALQ